MMIVIIKVLKVIHTFIKCTELGAGKSPPLPALNNSSVTL